MPVAPAQLVVPVFPYSKGEKGGVCLPDPLAVCSLSHLVAQVFAQPGISGTEISLSSPGTGIVKTIKVGWSRRPAFKLLPKDFAGLGGYVDEDDPFNPLFMTFRKE